jgi:sugar phosphate isomerase/epimerase
MKIALHQITTIRASFEEDLTAYRQAGWTAFEMHLSKASQFIEKNGMDGFRKFVGDSGMSPIAATGHVVLAFASAAEMAANEEQLKRELEIMSAVGCPVIVFGGDAAPAPPAPNQTESGLSERDRAYRSLLARFALRVGHLADIAKSFGVTMALEVNWCGMCRSVSTAAEVIEIVHRPNVGLLFDTAHFACTPSRLSDLDRLSGKIVAGHLDDMRDAPPEIRNVNNDRVIPGDGVLPLVEWLDKVEACGFTGWHSVELFCEDLWKQPVLDIAKKVKAGCENLWPDAQF